MTHELEVAQSQYAMLQQQFAAEQQRWLEMKRVLEGMQLSIGSKSV
jgi:hypothetical protein